MIKRESISQKINKEKKLDRLDFDWKLTRRSLDLPNESFLKSHECAKLKKEYMMIHVQSVDIFFSNKNSQESIYDFMEVQHK